MGSWIKVEQPGLEQVFLGDVGISGSAELTKLNWPLLVKSWTGVKVFVVKLWMRW